MHAEMDRSQVRFLDSNGLLVWEIPAESAFEPPSLNIDTTSLPSAIAISTAKNIADAGQALHKRSTPETHLGVGVADTIKSSRDDNGEYDYDTDEVTSVKSPISAGASAARSSMMSLSPSTLGLGGLFGLSFPKGKMRKPALWSHASDDTINLSSTPGTNYGQAHSLVYATPETSGNSRRTCPRTIESQLASVNAAIVRMPRGISSTTSSNQPSTTADEAVPDSPDAHSDSPLHRRRLPRLCQPQQKCVPTKCCCPDSWNLRDGFRSRSVFRFLFLRLNIEQTAYSFGRKRRHFLEAGPSLLVVESSSKYIF